MKTVYKYPFEITDSQIINIPIGAEVVHVGLDPNGASCFWALVDAKDKAIPTTLYVVGTGHPVPDDGIFIGTFIAATFVWHVFIAP